MASLVAQCIETGNKPTFREIEFSNTPHHSYLLVVGYLRIDNIIFDNLPSIVKQLLLYYSFHITIKDMDKYVFYDWVSACAPNGVKPQSTCFVAEMFKKHGYDGKKYKDEYFTILDFLSQKCGLDNEEANAVMDAIDRYPQKPISVPVPCKSKPVDHHPQYISPQISKMNEYIDTAQDANISCVGKDIDHCIALQRITSILSFYTTNYDDSDAVDAFLSKYNMRERLVNDYHHVIDKHLNEDNHSKRKCDKQFELIYRKMMEENHLFCSIHTCSIWMRNNRQRELSPNTQCVIMDILDTIHCYFMHSVDIGHRIIIQDDPHFDDNARMAFLRRYLAPKKSTQWQKKVAMRNDRFTTRILDKPLTMEGYLRKQSMHLKKLRQRYIVLENECLYSYKTDLKEELTERIELNAFDHVQISTTGPIGQFELIQEDNHNNKRVFIAATMKELDDWFVALKENMLRVKEHASEEEKKCDHHDKNIKKEKEVESFGERYEYWSSGRIYSKYVTIKEEMTVNKIYPINMDAFNSAFAKSKFLLKNSHKMRNMMTCTDVASKYNLHWDAVLRIDHILALVLWTDYHILSAEFRQTFHKISKQIYDEFCIWSRFLIECVNAFGTRLKKSKNKMCFHIIQNNRSSSLQYMQYETVFNAPASMTTKLEIAILNAPDKNGFILELTNYKKLRYFNCSFVSYFGNEDERLFVEPPHVEKNYYLHVLSIRNLATNEKYSDKKEICGGGDSNDELVICDKECKANTDA